MCITLIIDDDHDAREDVVGILETCGISAFQARSASEALGIVRDHPEIAVIILDLDTGQFPSLSLGVQLRQARPATPIIFTAKDPCAFRIPRELVGTPILAKPVSRAALIECAAESLRADTCPCHEMLSLRQAEDARLHA